jgi:hypothetical protein
MISEIFSTSFLFSIAVIIIAAGGLFAYFNYRLSEHNHKMQAMMGLVSTMADEMQYFRSKIHNSPVLNDNNTNTNINTHVVPNFLGGAINEDDLIEVSDSDADEEEEEESSDADSDSDSDSDASSDADSNLEDLEDLDDLEEDMEDDDNSVKIITIDIDLGAGNEMPIESENIEETEHDKNDSIDLNLSNLEEELDLDLSLKSISIDTNVSMNKEKDDYKKMSLNKLRDLVCEKGLVKDSSKLKKNELLKLLGVE